MGSCRLPDIAKDWKAFDSHHMWLSHPMWHSQRNKSVWQSPLVTVTMHATSQMNERCVTVTTCDFHCACDITKDEKGVTVTKCDCHHAYDIAKEWTVCDSQQMWLYRACDITKDGKCVAVTTCNCHCACDIAKAWNACKSPQMSQSGQILSNSPADKCNLSCPINQLRWLVEMSACSFWGSTQSDVICSALTC